MIVVTMLSMFFTACSKDDNDSEQSSKTNGDKSYNDDSALLLGRWTETYLSSYDTYEYLTFKKDGTAIWIVEYYEDDRLDDRINDTFIYSYDSSSKKLTFTYNDGINHGSLVYIITKLTEDKLEFYSEATHYEHSFER